MKKFFPVSFEETINKDEKNDDSSVEIIETKKMCSLKTYQDGFEEGMIYALHLENNKSLTNTYSKILDIMYTVEKSLLNLENIEKSKMESFKKEVGQTVKICLSVLFPYMKKELNIKNIIRLIEKTLHSLKKNFKITAYMSLDDKEKILEFFQDKLDCLDIVFKNDILSGHCMLSWDGGGAFWNPDLVYEKINSILEEEECANDNNALSKKELS